MLGDILDFIRRDIAAFADPATPVQVSDRGAEWHQRRQQYKVTFLRSSESEWPDIQIEERRYGYAEFFASEHMGDMKALAENIFASINVPSPYVEGKARKADEIGEVAHSDALVRALCKENLPYLRTQVVFLRAPAGAGKTVLLRHLAVEQAIAFQEGRETFLYLYIDAQGRALSRLDEAMAAVLNDLRSFTYHAVPVLTRLGLLVPIIDGFDELLGIGGYQEAFSSLASFLARLDGRGALIASARASFYALSDFDRAASAVPSGKTKSLNYEIIPIELLDWDESELATYLEYSGKVHGIGAETPQQGVRLLKEKVGDAGSALLRTPFFASAVVSLLEGGKDIPPGSHILRALVHMFIDREVGKLQDKHGSPILTSAQHLRLLELIADEMWWQGVRELDPGTITTVAELACEEFAISVESSRALIGRVRAHALLTVQGSTNKILFQHEYYYGFFLGGRLANAIINNESLSEFLGRSFISTVVAEETIFSLDMDSDKVKILIDRLGAVRHSVLVRDVIRSNAGLLYASVIRHHGRDISGTIFNEGYFDANDLSGSWLKDTIFRQCEFRRIDLRNATWQDVRLEKSQIMLPIVNMDSRLGLIDVRVPEDVQGIAIRNGEERNNFDPSEVKVILQSLGATISVVGTLAPVLPPISANARAHIALLTRFIRMINRVYNFSQSDLDNRRISQQREWKVLEKLLRKYDLIQEVLVQRRGPTGAMMRLSVSGTELEQGEAYPNAQTSVGKFWQELRSL